MMDSPCVFLKKGVGVTLCIQKALAEAGIAKEDINYINAHATSTPAGDLKEYEALVRCFGDNPEVMSFYILPSITCVMILYMLDHS